jgi:hypothetical protein
MKYQNDYECCHDNIWTIVVSFNEATRKYNVKHGEHDNLKYLMVDESFIDKESSMATQAIIND